MYNIIVNMYSCTKSCISYNDCKSEFFPYNNGVRQGENLHPFLFAASWVSISLEIDCNPFKLQFVKYDSR
jgi:hypothetical protein